MEESKEKKKDGIGYTLILLILEVLSKMKIFHNF